MFGRIIRVSAPCAAVVCLLACPAFAGQSLLSDRPGQVRSGQVRSGQVGSGTSSSGNLHIAPIKSHPHGRSYSEWIAEWWRWALEIPAAANPLLDETGEDCAEGQRGHVWFLAGTFGSGSVTRSCTIPAGTALFFPLANGVWASTPAAPSCDIPVADPWYLAEPEDPDWALFETEILNNPAVVRPPNNADVLTLTVDGHAAGNLNKYYAQSTIFSATLPVDNIFGCGELNNVLTSPDVGWGYHVYLNPLPSGEHTIQFTSTTFGQDVTYHLIVAP